ncbi:uncharacterized protein LOC131227277 [Magnolia sinica]|uniref:uncharacterized protein LOC131227277 n=1 Tax=Magnolia sinica TaxID=86752 RepID=UPI002658EE24|nr:uncharacterized protein LOC131227277 [Magnolia sinica]XP_058079033.1 uncharacterized protein LOC131227277 [Magnolia sinica]
MAMIASDAVPLLFFFLFCFFGLLFQRGSAQALSVKQEHAHFPPRGWNSYDSFCWTVSEEEFLQNAELVSKRLSSHGYEYVVVDYLWYRRKVPGAYVNSLGFDVIDEWGRVIPDPDRWPSSRGGKGFKEVAKKVHDMGLKFGIHVMRGISTQAVNANTPILDTLKGGPYTESGKQWLAQDIGLREKPCVWMDQGFMSVDTDLGAGRAFLRSLYQQYADWDVDFVKHDCVFGQDLNVDEIHFVSEVLKKLDRPVVYSLSPGTSVTPAMAAEVRHLVNMYRVTGDDWDSWADVETHFNVSRDFANSHLIGAEGLKGKSWPDLDMLPLGWLTDQGTNVGPHRKCNLTLDEQKTQMTLWSMGKSPIIFGGDMRQIDETTFNLITNPTILEINTFSKNNKEFPHITARHFGNFDHSRSLTNVNTADNGMMSLTSCKDRKAKGWVIESHDGELDQICWKDSLGSNDRPPFCLYKRQPLLTSDEEIIYKQKYQGKFHLSVMAPTEFCLDASTGRKQASDVLKQSSLSPCKWVTNQLWELNHDGTLANSYSGLCATMGIEKGIVNAGGVRSWVATGRKGEIYLSFFNLNLEKTVISAKLKDLAKALPTQYLRKLSCKCTEVWSGKRCKIQKQTLAAVVETHGCALFVLNCN